MPYAVRASALAAATGACFLFFWIGSFLLSWVVLPSACFVLRRTDQTVRVQRCQEIVGWGFRLFIASMRTVRNLVFRPWGVELDVPAGPFVMIANHPTLVDVTAVMAVHPRICCVAKTELFQSVLVGKLLRYCGHIEGGGGAMDGATVIRQAVSRLRRGHSVLIFPEGTRSPTYGLRRFQPGAFEVALRGDVPIVPLFITCEPPTLQKGLSWYGLPKRTAVLRIRQLETVAAGRREDAAAMAARFQELYEDELTAWNAGVPVGERSITGCPSAREMVRP